MKSMLESVAKRLIFPIPPALRRNHIHIDASRLRNIERSITENYHRGRNAPVNDLEDHSHKRLESDRRTVIPWLHDARPLRNRRILEIGCGTGSSTLALAEQGAIVTGVDIDKGALAVARDRLNAYGVDAELKALNATELKATFGLNFFEVIVFFACLEHMTLEERLTSLRDVWDMLPRGGLLVIVETPNRLWYFDHHTALLPFFHWLPDELAFQYSRFSPRENFNDLYRDYTSECKEHFLRRGRGMSFHELEIAIGPARQLNVVSSLSSFQGIRYGLVRPRMDRRHKSLLMSIMPGLHEGFCDEMLYLIIAR
jgi:2-polyprenyl-3-methyl-5-hydroxy-6-metoxy-1,4-benzoquinol methylase